MTGPEDNQYEYDDAVATEILINLDDMATDACQVGSEWMSEENSDE
jgi:hypothetical protein